MAEYKKLSLLISENKGDLCCRLEGLSLPSDAETIKQLCIDYISALTRKDAEYMNQLSLLEQDLLSPVLNVMDTLYSSDIELSQKVSSILTQEKFQHPDKTQTNKKSITKEFGPAIAGSAGGTILAALCKPGSWGVILFGSVISGIVGKVLYGLYVDNNVIDVHSNSLNDFPKYELNRNDVTNIVNGLITAGKCVDKVLLTYRKHLEILKDDYDRMESTFELEKKYIGVLECYQSLLGNLKEMAPSPLVSDSIKKIIQLLQKQGFKAIDYTEDVKGLFNIKEDDVESEEQYSPAIVKISSGKEMLILKGDVVIPNN